MDRLAVAYHVDDSYYPNVGPVGGSGATPGAQRTYWSNLLVLAASVRRWGSPDLVFEVHTNTAPPDDLAPHLDALSVERRPTPFDREPPRDYAERYRASFYLFDVLEDLVDRMEDGDRAAIVDPDCVFIDDVDRLWRRVDRDGVVVHHIEQPAGLVRHGQSRASLGTIFADEHGGEPTEPVWIGGELLGFGPETGRTLADLAGEGWERSLARYADDRPYLMSDEHVHTYVFWRLGRSEGNAGDLVARLYTNTHPLPRTVSKDPRGVECRLALWHLPGEKEVGLKQLLPAAILPDGALLSLEDEPYRELVGRTLGVLPTVRRRVADEARRLRRVPYRLRERLARH